MKNYSSKLKVNITTNLLNSQKTSSKSIISNVNNSYELEINDFLKCIEQDEKPLIDGWEGLKSLEIGVAALKSANQNKIINNLALENYWTKVDFASYGNHLYFSQMSYYEENTGIIHVLNIDTNTNGMASLLSQAK